MEARVSNPRPVLLPPSLSISSLVPCVFYFFAQRVTTKTVDLMVWVFLNPERPWKGTKVREGTKVEGMNNCLKRYACPFVCYSTSRGSQVGICSLSVDIFLVLERRHACEYVHSLHFYMRTYIHTYVKREWVQTQGWGIKEQKVPIGDSRTIRGRRNIRSRKANNQLTLPFVLECNIHSISTIYYPDPRPKLTKTNKHA